MVHPSKYAEGRRASNKMVCRVCLKDHPLRFCKKFLQGSYEERMRLVSIYRYCAGCLSHDHTWRTCESTGKCKRCGDMHHTLLHKGDIRPSSLARKSPKRLRRGPSSSKRQEHKRRSSPDNSARGPRSSDGHESERPRSSQALVLSTSKSRNTRRRRRTKQSKNLVARSEEAVSLPLYHIKETILLKPTAIVRLDSNGRFVNVRAIIDPSSESSIISEELARRISALKIRVGKTERCCLKITGHHGFSMVIESYAEVRRNYTVMAPVKSIDSKVLDEFPGLQLADPQFNAAEPVNLLLGADVYTRIIRNGVYGGSFGKPLAQFTIFGYIISGSCSP